MTPSAPAAQPTRYGSVLRVRPEHFKRYRAEHAAVWPGVLAMIERCHIRNYSIYHHDGLLFGYYEYWGTDHAHDMALMAADAETRRWWDLMEPMQQPLATRAPGEWWARMDEVFHHDGPPTAAPPQ